MRTLRTHLKPRHTKTCADIETMYTLYGEWSGIVPVPMCPWYGTSNRTAYQRSLRKQMQTWNSWFVLASFVPSCKTVSVLHDLEYHKVYVFLIQNPTKTWYPNTIDYKIVYLDMFKLKHRTHNIALEVWYFRSVMPLIHQAQLWWWPRGDAPVLEVLSVWNLWKVLLCTSRSS